MTGDARFEEAASEVRKEGGPRTVCEVLDRIEARGEAKGHENTLLVSVKNLMKSTRWTAEQAMDALGISAAEQEKLKAKLNL